MRTRARLAHRLLRLPLHPTAEHDRADGDFCWLCDDVPVGCTPRAPFPQTRIDGCPCGAPATRVRYERGPWSHTHTGIFSCDEHADVNGWRHCSDGTWVPVGDYSRAALDHLTRALPA